MAFKAKPPVNPNDKRIVNGSTDINQLAPFKYKWAWEYFLNANKNHWVPSEIQMQSDKSDYELKLSEYERHVFTNVLAYLTTSDILALRNIAIAMMEKITAPEVQIYLARQIAEECLTKDHLVHHEEKGWISIAKVQVGDRILTYDRSEKEVRYEPVKYTHIYKHTKGLYRFEGKGISQVTSTYHRMLVKRDGKLVFLHAKTLYKESVGDGDLGSKYAFPVYDPKKEKISYVTDVKVTFDSEAIEDVYCLSLRTGTIVVKHDGNVSITGNSIHCYTEDTLVFTEKGFIPFKDITSDTLVAQVSDAGYLEMTRHLGVTKDRYKGPIYRIYDKKYDRRTIKVTPNHNCVYYSTITQRYHKIHADQLSTLLDRKDVYLPILPHNGFKESGRQSDRYDWLVYLFGLYEKYGYQYDYIRSENKTVLYLQLLSEYPEYTYLLDNIPNIRKYYELSITRHPDHIDLVIVIPRIVDLDNPMDYLNSLYITKDNIQTLIDLDVYDYWDIWASMGNLRNLSALLLMSLVTKDYSYVNWTVDTDTPEGHMVPIKDIEIETYEYDGYVYSVGVPSKRLLVYTDNTFAVDGNTWTYQHCIETIGLDQLEVYNRYRTVPEIHAKIDYSSRIINEIAQPDLDLSDRQTLIQFLKGYFFFCGIFEGLWFYNGFNPIFALQRMNKMRGTGEQLQYILRDEALHVSFGLKLIQTVFTEENIQIPDDEIYEMIDIGYRLESDYIGYILPTPIPSYSKEIHMAQYEYMANRRLKALGYPPMYPDAKNRAVWLTEQATVRKEKNFFETRVTEYEAGGLEW